MHLLLHPPPGRALADWLPRAWDIARRHPGAHLVASPRYDGQDRGRIERAARLAGALGLGLVASAEPIMHHGSRRRLDRNLPC